MLAHIHIMKTGGQSLSDILNQAFPFQHCGIRSRGYATAADLKWAMGLYPDLKSISGHGVVPHGNLEEACSLLRYFTFLRNPVQRCLSHYQFAVQQNGERQSFRDWLVRRTNYQVRMLTGTRSAEQAIEMLETKVQFVGLLERFEESLVLWRRWVGEPGMNLRQRTRNIATDNRHKAAIMADPELVALIHESHVEDFKLYEYANSVVYPRQVRDYGPSLAADVARLDASEPPLATLSFRDILSSCWRNLVYKPLMSVVHRAA